MHTDHPTAGTPPTATPDRTPDRTPDLPRRPDHQLPSLPQQKIHLLLPPHVRFSPSPPLKRDSPFQLSIKLINHLAKTERHSSHTSEEGFTGGFGLGGGEEGQEREKTRHGGETKGVEG